METRPFGLTGLVVSALGLGAGPLGDPGLSDGDAERLIDTALDCGITLIDTARAYGSSEERIGRALRGQRRRAVLSTKVGYGVAGARDWTAEAVTRGIDEALARLATDYLDIVHLHSCTRDVLRAGDVTGALTEAVAAGKVLVAGYSGDNAALDEAVESGAFGAIELSLSPWDQGAIDRVLWKAKERGMGAIAKRPLANAWWTHRSRPARADVAEYWERGHALAIPTFGLAPEALSARFAVFTWGIDSAIVGTTSPEHLEELADIIDGGPLPPYVVRAVREAWWRSGPPLPGVV